nr:PKD domain-containing protein [uncultured Desulfobulbus sp.]
MQRIIHRLVTLLFCSLLFTATAFAETRTIQVEWGYTPPSEPEVTGFTLYQEGSPVCETQNPNATSMQCEVDITALVTNFTLVATFADGSKSQHSAPFALGSLGEPHVGNKQFTFHWEPPEDTSIITGYNIWLNGEKLCATTTPSDTSISCTANLIAGEMEFSMSQVLTDGTESERSNLLNFNPTSYPEIYTFKSLDFTWDYTGDPTAITAFRVYQNNMAICQTTDTTARSLTCVVDVPSDALAYGIKAVDVDDKETELSNVLAYFKLSPEPSVLFAVIQADQLEGTAPLTVNFDAASSTGNIIQYQWDFGDGSTGEASQISKEYSNAGTYTAKLNVVDSLGVTSSAFVSVVVNEPVVVNSPPIAVISSSVAVGAAPLVVSFDGSKSTVIAPATISSYFWSFGDGTSASGANVSHSFTSAGTYSASLQVIDSNGLTDTTTTPVVVTAATENAAPTAAINVTPNSGAAPLTVTFDASGSADSDGSIASYTWHYGDGGSGTSKTVTHTYTTEASFTATLQVTDDLGATGTASTTVTVQPEEDEASLNVEIGEVAVTGDWVRVSLETTFTDPIVVAGPASFNDAAPGAIRLRNVDSTGFDIKFAEWNYLDAIHGEEFVSYLVVEKGLHTLPNGLMLEAGSFAGTTKWATIPYSQSFATAPLVLTTVATANEEDAISGRVKSVTTTGFSYYFREQELNVNKHVAETVFYLAWEPGKGDLGMVNYSVVTSAGMVQDSWKNLAFTNVYSTPPLLLADMQTCNSTEPSSLRMQSLSSSGVEVKIEEEQSKDAEVAHVEETVGYIALAQSQEIALATFTWTYDTAQELNISGFSIEANGKQVCTVSDPSARQVQCEIARPAEVTTFTIRALENSGELSEASNGVLYAP